MSVTVSLDAQYEQIKVMCRVNLNMFYEFSSNGSSLGLNDYLFIINISFYFAGPHLQQSDAKAPFPGLRGDCS